MIFYKSDNYCPSLILSYKLIFSKLSEVDLSMKRKIKFPTITPDDIIIFGDGFRIEKITDKHNDYFPFTAFDEYLEGVFGVRVRWSNIDDLGFLCVSFGDSLDWDRTTKTEICQFINNLIQLGSMANRETYTKIVTCSRCGGKGYTREWHDRERGYDQVVCTTCGGLRVLEKVVSVEFKKIEHAGKTEIPSTALETQGPGE
mgnify:FL=1